MVISLIEFVLFVYRTHLCDFHNVSVVVYWESLTTSAVCSGVPTFSHTTWTLSCDTTFAI